jgi:hypothetical protein
MSQSSQFTPAELHEIKNLKSRDICEKCFELIDAPLNQWKCKLCHTVAAKIIKCNVSKDGPTPLMQHLKSKAHKDVWQEFVAMIKRGTNEGLVNKISPCTWILKLQMFTIGCV